MLIFELKCTILYNNTIKCWILIGQKYLSLWTMDSKKTSDYRYVKAFDKEMFI